MRKTFKFICAAVVAAFAVSSCYDDALVWDELDKHAGEIAGLTERVAALETKLNSEVATLNGTISALEGKLAAADEKLNKALTDLATRLDAKDAEIAADVKNVLAQVDALKKSAEESTVDAVLKALQEKDTKLEKDLADLATKLGTDLEAVSKELLAELAEALESVAVQKVEEKDGTVVLTLANGKTVTLATPDANANNTGLVTVVDGEWHVVLEDGTTKSLDVPVGVEEIEFQVNYETYELEFSVNGGEFVGTGAYVADSYEYLVYGTAYEEEDYVTLTIGGVEYNLPKVNETKAMLLAGLTYFENEEQVTVPLKNAVSAFVVSTPKGWAAEVSTDPLALVVTAPAEDNAEAETSGKVEVWMLGEDGKVFSAVLPVVISKEMIIIAFDEETRKVNFTFGEESVYDSYYDEWTTSTVIAYYGACPVDEFDAESIIENYTNQLTNMDPATQSGTPSVEVLIDELVSGQLDASKDYVIWAFVEKLGRNPQTWMPECQNTPDDIVKVFCNISALDILESTPSLADVSFKFNVLAPSATGFYGIFMNEEMYNMIPQLLEQKQFTFDMILNGGFVMDGVPANLYEGTTFEGKLSEFGYPSEYLQEGVVNDILPGGYYYIGVIPVNAGQSVSDFTWDDINFAQFTTAELSMGATIAMPEYTVTEDYEASVLHIGESTDIAYAFYRVYQLDAEGNPLEELPTESNCLEKVTNVPSAFYYLPYDGAGFDLNVDNSYGVLPGTKYKVALVLIDSDAKAALHLVDVKTKAIPYANTSLSVTMSDIAYMPENNKAVATFTCPSVATQLFYLCNNSTGYTEYNGATSIAKVLNGNTKAWVVVDLTTAATKDETAGTYTYTAREITVSGNNYSDRDNYIHAFVMDADGNVCTITTSEKFVAKKKSN